MDSTTSADVHEPEEPEEMQETIFEEKDEAAADEAVDNAETEGTTTDADSADASDSFRRTSPILRHRMKITAGSRR